jgi:hypothetical protein
MEWCQYLWVAFAPSGQATVAAAISAAPKRCGLVPTLTVLHSGKAPYAGADITIVTSSNNGVTTTISDLMCA